VGNLDYTLSLDGPRVLVIDDDEVALEAIKAVLERSRYQVRCLVSTIGATQVILSEGIEAIVVDLNMPVMHGDRFIALLRSWDKLRDIPTVLISSAPLETLNAIARQLPGVGAVAKDTMHRTLPAMLHRVLAPSRKSSLHAPVVVQAAAKQRK
jgi:CheY-like chemotaxis protein